MIHYPRVDLHPIGFEELVSSDKTNLGALRLMHFLALAVLAARFIPRDWASLKNYIARPVILCGQYPLEILCLGVFLSIVTEFETQLTDGKLSSELLVSAIGIAVMIFGFGVTGIG